MRITLHQLAAELGISATAVSMALRNHPRISEATRGRVKDLALERGYVPNPALARQASLRSGKAHPPMPLAWVRQANPVQAGLAVEPEEEAMLRKLAATLGYRLQVIRHDATLPVSRINDLLWNRGVEAVLLGPVFDASLIDGLAWDRICAVAWGVGHLAPPCHMIMADVGQSIVQAVTLCRERGYRRIGLVQFPEILTPTDYLDRYGASHLCAHGMNWGKARFDSVDISDAAPDDFAAWVHRFEPDAVIGQTSLLYWWLREGGRQPGRDVGFVAINLDPAAEEFRISGFVLDYEQTAALALQQLDADVRAFKRGKPSAPSRQLVSMPWFEGDSLPPRDALRRA